MKSDRISLGFLSLICLSGCGCPSSSRQDFMPVHVEDLKLSSHTWFDYHTGNGNSQISGTAKFELTTISTGKNVMSYLDTNGITILANGQATHFPPSYLSHWGCEEWTYPTDAEIAMNTLDTTITVQLQQAGTTQKSWSILYRLDTTKTPAVTFSTPGDTSLSIGIQIRDTTGTYEFELMGSRGEELKFKLSGTGQYWIAFSKIPFLNRDQFSSQIYSTNYLLSMNYTQSAGALSSSPDTAAVTYYVKEVDLPTSMVSIINSYRWAHRALQ
jgi:hypothetical protein